MKKIKLLFVIIACAVFLMTCEKSNTPPSVSFSITPENGDTDTIFTFDASNCVDTKDETSQLKVRWDFETDGIWDIPYSSVKTIKHQFLEEGNYTISLEVMNTDGIKGSTSKQLYVTYTNHFPAIPSFPLPNNEAVGENLTINLSWTCTDPEGDPLLFDIYFGDESPPPLVETGWSEKFYVKKVLSTNTKYYWKIIARDDKEHESEGLIWQFKTTPYQTFTDARDGHEYRYVIIGDQTWMADNLAWLPAVSFPSITSSYHPFYYVYAFVGTDISDAMNTENYKTYGVLYNWGAAIKSCPSGWHLPSEEEWNSLKDFLGGTYVAGGKLKETGTSHWNKPNQGATNELGFSALPGGYNHYEKNFLDIGKSTIFWFSKDYEYSYWNSQVPKLEYNGTRAHSSGYYINIKENGFSVRCIKNE